ncbi:MAG: hypothetical protein LQ340_006174, partial [Diploschistes diacapsis]
FCGGVGVPDYYRCVGGAGDEEAERGRGGAGGDGGPEDALYEVAVAVCEAPSADACLGVPGPDGTVPAAGVEDGICVRARGDGKREAG